MKKVRIGIDVGGTFTDAVLIDNENGEIIAKAKTPTTHYNENGVAQGIINIVKQIMDENDVSPADVTFIAHGTTQATNALLEGDVAKVGIIGIGSGSFAKKELTIGDIELAENRYLKTVTKYITSDEVNENLINELIDQLISEGCKVIVASEEYSIDNPENEDFIVELCNKRNIYATAGHNISELYGLKVRTRTAVVNASLIPKMLETAKMTERVVKEVGISTELMIMRADGGVMSVNEVKKRPILTMLSGLAAGVAGALIHEKVTDGIFMEVGGTSIDISVIKAGKVMVSNATIGGHKTYLKALDVRTLAVAGGSMVRIHGNKIIDVGPRSAHLAGKEYECFTDTENINGAKVELITPIEGDPSDYAIVKCNNHDYAYTLAGAANVLKLIPEGDYASGNYEATYKAWEVLAQQVGKTVEETAQEVMDIACDKIWKVIKNMVDEYEIEIDFLELVGGGGSAAVTTIALGNKFNLKSKIADNAPYISTIGVALAMIREQIERSVVNPTIDDIKQIRADVTSKIIEAGAKRETIHVEIDVDKQKNILTATASGASDFGENNVVGIVEVNEIKEKLVHDYKTDIQNIELKDGNTCHHVFNISTTKKSLFGLIKSKSNITCVSNTSGVILARVEKGDYTIVSKNNIDNEMHELIEDYSTYSDAGQTIPRIKVFTEVLNFDYSGLTDMDQVKSMLALDLEFINDEEKIIVVAERK